MSEEIIHEKNCDKYNSIDEAWEAWCEHNIGSTIMTVPVLRPPTDEIRDNFRKWIPTTEDLAKFQRWLFERPSTVSEQDKKDMTPAELLYTAIKEMIARMSYLYGKTDGTFEPPAIKEIYEIGDRALREYEKRKKDENDGSTENG